MADNDCIIGNITHVRWHTILFKISQYNYGNRALSFDESNFIIRDDENKEYRNLNRNMNPDKNYAMVTLDKCGNIFIRNLFDSKHPKGFEQKNTYFRDDIADKFIMADENDVLLNYIKLAYPGVTTLKNIDHHDWLYFCVEYKINDGLNLNLLNYFILLGNKYSQLEHRLKDIEEKIEENTTAKKQHNPTLQRSTLSSTISKFVFNSR